MLGDLVDLLGDVGLLGLVAITAALAFSETAIGLDLLVPGEAGMVLAGAAADNGDHPLGLIILAGAVGATAGDCVSYLVGRCWGRAVLRRFAGRRDPIHLWRRAEQWFERWGGAAVFLGRWIGAVRAVIPAVAGASRMSFPRFLLWNVAASLAWSTVAVSVGFIAGPHAAEWLDDFGWWTYIFAAATIAAVLLRRRLAHREVRAGARRPGD